MPEDEVVSLSTDVDTDALYEQFEAEWAAENPEEDNPEQVEPNAQEEPGEQGDGDADGESEEGEEDDQVNDPDVHKRNEAFKRQREEIKELSRYRDFVAKMATDNGFENPDQIFEAYEQQALAKEAEERGVDLETMQEIDTLRRQEEARAIEARAEEFQQERDAVIEKFGLSEEDVQAVYDFVHANGYQELGFEQAYKLANYDHIVESARNEGRQNYLSDKKQRQQTAALNPGSNSINNSGDSGGDLSDDEFEKTLAAMGVSLD